MNCRKLIANIGLSILLAGAMSIHAQEAVLTSGSEAIGSGGNASYSIGQIGYTAQTGANGSVEAGVQQSYSIITSLGAEVTGIQLELSAYPNPVQQTLILKVEDYNQEQLTYFLFDVQGKLIVENSVSSDVTAIQVEHLPKATYFLRIMEKNQPIKTFNIIKN